MPARMKFEFSMRPSVDLRNIGEQSRKAFGEAMAVALETYIRATIARIAVVPNGAQPLPQRPGVRVVPLIRYPFKIFYSVIEATVMILHIRHAARRPWRVE
jgi:plasmid stabilization system protein ParE